MDFKIDRAPGFGIARTSHLLQTEIRNGLNRLEVDLSVEELSVLLLLCRMDKPIRVNDLAKLAVRDGTTLKRQINGLVGLGLVVQKRDSADRRAVLISCTRPGLELVEFVRPMLQEIRKNAFQGIEHRDLETAVKVLNQVQANLQA